ncbi:MAG: hypothetical protein EXS29_05495 [Pedosphaera sp.]|nr:hypothetical protein [Pedosphaera sp.]
MKPLRTFLFVLALAGAVVALAQGLPGEGVQRGIKFPEHDRQNGRLKSLLFGATAVQQPDGLVLVTGMRVETYTYRDNVRALEMIVESPACVFDFRTKIASSSGPMKAYRADGSFTLEGVGFQWCQTNSMLSVSNQVRTLVRSDLFLSPPKSSLK